MFSVNKLKDHTHFFARIRLHGLTKSSDGTPCPIDLERRASFPMPGDNVMAVVKDHHDRDLSARSLAPRYEIEAQVCFDRPLIHDHSPDDHEGALGVGRAGIVYPLEILSVRHATSQTPSSEDLPELPPLCIKIATPAHARNLAREAWFYEHFDERGLTGLIAPRSYGVFHTPKIPDDLTIDIPGYNYHENASRPYLGISELYTSCMREEYYDRETCTLRPNMKRFLEDPKNSYTKSEWTMFRETPEVTPVTVLVMDMLGAEITVEDFERDWEGDLNDVFDHLVVLDFLHADLRFPNVLRVPPHLQVPCPMHPNAIPGHNWNIIDWENAKLLCMGNRKRDLLWGQRSGLSLHYHEAGGMQHYELNKLRKDVDAIREHWNRCLSINDQ